MPKKSKEERMRENEERIAKLKLLIAEKNKKEQERIQRMNKKREDKAKEDYIKNNQVLKKYSIKNLEDAKNEVNFWGRVLGKIDNKEMFDLRGNEYFSGSAEYMPFIYNNPQYEAIPYPDPNKSSYKKIVNLFYPPFKRIVERYLDKDLQDDYQFEKGFPTRGEIANLVDSVNTVIDRYSTITSKKLITRADYTSDEYDTDSTVASDYFEEDSDSDFEGRLDREVKPLKQGRLTVVEDKPRVFIDDKSFLF